MELAGRLERRRPVADGPDMASSIGPLTGGVTSGFGAMAAGVRHELRIDMMRRAMDDAGLLDANLARAMEAVEETARGLTRAGAVAARHEMIGEVIDILG